MNELMKRGFSFSEGYFLLRTVFILMLLILAGLRWPLQSIPQAHPRPCTSTRHSTAARLEWVIIGDSGRSCLAVLYMATKNTCT